MLAEFQVTNPRCPAANLMVDNLDPPKKGLTVFPYEVPYVYISMAIAWETTMVISGYLVASGSRNNKGIDKKTFDRVEVAPSTGPWAPHVVLHLLVTLAAKISDGNGYI